MNAPPPEKIIEKFNKQMDVFVKHEELLTKQRQLYEQKITNVFDRNLQIEERDRSMHEQIQSSRYQNEQLKLQQERQKQLEELKKQKKEQRVAVNQLWQQEQKQHEKEIQHKLAEIQQKIKYEEFKKKTDDLINQLDQNLRQLNLRYLTKQEQKDKYLNDFQQQKHQTLNTSMQLSSIHQSNVYSNYQEQMKRIQEICQRKVKIYEQKIKKIIQQKNQQNETHTQKVLQTHEHQEAIKNKSYQIYQTKLNTLQQKMFYFQDKINQIEKKRLQNLQQSVIQEQQVNQRRSEIRAKSENIYRNKSINLLTKQIEKERLSQQVQEYNQMELQNRLQRLNEKWQANQSQVMKADQLKQSYYQQLEQKITQRDQRLQDQIQNKLDLQRRRLKVIEEMEKQKRDLLLKLDQDKIPITNTTEMRYLFSTPKPQQQSKLFIT